MAVNVKNMPDDEFFFGHKACAGCGGSLAVRAALVETGVPEGSIASCDDSTASHGGRFFSYRAEEGRCGRHAALAVLGSDAREAWRPAPLG